MKMLVSAIVAGAVLYVCGALDGMRKAFGLWQDVGPRIERALK